LDEKNGSIYKWHRYDDLTDATTPLPEGTDPDAQAMANVSLTAQVAWYGTYLKITDVVDMTNQDPVLTIAADKLGRNEGKTFDTLGRDILAATASQVNAAGGVNGSTPTEITRSDIDGCVETLLGNDADFVAPMIKAGTGQGTLPVRAAFWGIIKSTIVMDLEACVGFVGVQGYSAQGGIEEAEWGSVGNVRFVQSSNAKLSSTIYPIPIIGKDAYGTVNLGKTKNVVKGFDTAGSPLNRYATSGWIAPWACRILNDLFMIQLRITAAA
jgi:N4-gp56 family major capsid protein